MATDKAVPAQAVPASPEVRKWFVGISIVIGVLMTISFLSSLALQKPQPQQNQLEESKIERSMFTLTLPANGYSNHIVPQDGYGVHYKGHGYVIHCVYASANEVGYEDSFFGDGKRSCGNGTESSRMLYQYLQDTTGAPNTVPYEFALLP